MAEHTRRVGLLKAVGASPGLVTLALMAENLVLALAAAAAGLAAGWLAAPLLTTPGAGLVGTPGGPSLTLSIAGLVLPWPSRSRWPRRSSQPSGPPAPAPCPRWPTRPARRGGGPALIRISRRLPVPLLFGLRLVARRPRRAVLGAASIAITITGIVAVLAFHATAGRKASAGPAG